MLERHGAEVVDFPDLVPHAPSSCEAMDDALRRLSRFDWILFAGSNSVRNFMARARKLGIDRPETFPHRLGAIGHGAALALKDAGLRVEYLPNWHIADAVASGLPDAGDTRMLLVRVEDSTDELAVALSERGAHTTAVAGYRMDVATTAADLPDLFGRRFDAVALSSPTSVRYLVRGAAELDVDLGEHLSGTAIAAVGVATAKAARDSGLEPDLTAGGRLGMLVQALVREFDRNESSGELG